MNSIIIFIFCIITVEAISEIISESKVFEGFRVRFGKAPWFLGWYLGGLVSCGYCLSVWLSIFAALIFPDRIFAGFDWWEIAADIVLKAFTIHRLSNAWHELINRWIKKIPYILFNAKTEIGFEETEDK